MLHIAKPFAPYQHPIWTLYHLWYWQDANVDNSEAPPSFQR